MNIISYRGPGMAGGVSSALARLWQQHGKTNASWWHLCGTEVQAASDLGEQGRDLLSLPKDMVDGHYRYCNEFLWPLMHDLPQFCRYRQEDHKLYVSFNRILSRAVTADRAANHRNRVFVQDYQMALLPDLLSRSGINSLIFWHIPWPRNVDPQYAPQLVQIAKGLASAEVVGFHTDEYCLNFLRFLHEHVPAARVDFDNGTVSRGGLADTPLPWESPDVSDNVRRPTLVVPAPLGIDPAFWRTSAVIPQIRLRGADFSWMHSGIPYVLSVDRADYTKGVVERFHAIDRFFERNPEKRGKLNFVQICGRTRIGLEAFDAYWHQCKVEAAKLESKWRTDHWSPLTWVEAPCSGAELSVIYRDAALMLVNPVRDGLNLTAKEFVASRVRRPGMLALSAGAGVWHELGEEAVRVEPTNPEQMARAIALGLNMEEGECARKITRMKMKVADNTLSDWWRQIAAYIAVTSPQVAADSSLVRTLRSAAVEN